MVILQFNKLIRNKWFWGAFAILISAAFCFDDLFTTARNEERVQGMAGKLAGGEVKLADFRQVADDVRGIGRNRDWKRPVHEVNRTAWETLAAVAVAKANGIEASDDEVVASIRRDRTFAVGGAFNAAVYRQVLGENGILPENFESFLRRQLTVSHVVGDLLDSASWVAPSELERALADMTDVLTVKAAYFVQDAEAAKAVTLDDAGLRAWYDDNVKALALPERMKLRIVRYDATDTNLLAKMTVTEDELHDFFDANGEKYQKLSTNGVDRIAMTFDEAKDKVEAELKRIAAVQCLETNLIARVYGVKAAEGASRLDEIAKEDGRAVALSREFALEGNTVEDFMLAPEAICRGAENFRDVVAELDPSSPDLRYGVVRSDRSVWLVECAETLPPHTPTFDEAKGRIRPRALKAAKEKAFKDYVEGIAAKGTNEIVTLAQNVTTNFTFSAFDLGANGFPDQMAIAGAAMRMAPGEVSDFVRLGPNRALLVICEGRTAGDATKAMLVRSQVRDQVAMALRRRLPEAWQRWNLERLGCEPGEDASMTEAETADEE